MISNDEEVFFAQKQVYRWNTYWVGFSAKQTTHLNVKKTPLMFISVKKKEYILGHNH